MKGIWEKIIGEVDEEYQGTAVEILTASDVEKWKRKWEIILQTAIVNGGKNFEDCPYSI